MTDPMGSGVARRSGTVGRGDIAHRRSRWISSNAFWSLSTLGLVIILARATAVGTKAPWFSSAVTTRLLLVTAIAAVAGTMAVALLAAWRSLRLRASLHNVDMSLAAVGAIARGEESGSQRFASEAATPEEIGLEDLLYSGVPEGPAAFPAGGPASPMAGEEEAPLVGVASVLAPARQALDHARRLVWPSVAGPIVLGTAFAGMCLAMAIGSEALAVRDFRLVTTVVLVVGYGWTVVLAWFVVAIATLPSVAVLADEARPRWASSGG